MAGTDTEANGTGQRYFVGVDVGGTTIKAGLFDAGLTLLSEDWAPTPRAAGSDEVVRAVVAAVTKAVAGCTRDYGAQPAAVGLAVLGTVDENAGVATASAATGWRDVPLRALVERAVSVPVGFGHDIRAAALAEARRGAGRGIGNLLFVALGTGVGAAVVLDGTPLRGAHARAGEIGHVPVAGHDEPCPCGGRGCLETVASARAVAARYLRRTGRALSAADVAGQARRADPDAVAVWDEATLALADVLAGCAGLLDPAAIVIGGGLAESGGQLLDPLRAALAARLHLGDPPLVTRAALGDRAALIGAGLLATAAFDKQKASAR